jgi:FkbM family methyltransferase
MAIKRIINKVISPIGLALTTKSNFDRLKNDSVLLESLLIWIEHEEDTQLLKFLSDYAKSSKAQHLQDLIALFYADKRKSKHDGFFVEFGAADGVIGSNSLLLESTFGWKGILAEPAKIFQKDLKRNRTAIIDDRCVSEKSGETVMFSESIEPCLSSISGFGISSVNFLKSKKYQVRTVSLEDLLICHNAPPHISFLSLDTEGSEYSILRNFPFEKYEIDLLVVEHNNREDRKDIFDLLVKNGFTRKYEASSLQDDYYVNLNLG